MNPTDIERKESAAVTLLTLMRNDEHLPEKRIENKDWHWFLRNLRITHAEHPLFPSTMEVIKFIVKHKSP
tara:strand:- start:2030 stop:2239 length:210 start_codon:yes stop_codon:yes gene_type:complete